MDLSTIDSPTLQAWHAEALRANHALMSGRQVVSASYSQATGSRSVSYTAANLNDLRQWIAQLEAALVKRGLLAMPPPRRRAIGLRY